MSTETTNPAGVTLNIDGELHSCSCGGNVFTKLSDEDIKTLPVEDQEVLNSDPGTKYVCNSCKTISIGT